MWRSNNRYERVEDAGPSPTGALSSVLWFCLFMTGFFVFAWKSDLGGINALVLGRPAKPAVAAIDPMLSSPAPGPAVQRLPNVTVGTGGTRQGGVTVVPQTIAIPQPGPPREGAPGGAAPARMAALPRVTGPGTPPRLPSVLTPSVPVGGEEASATRGRDGSFGFDTETNGVHMPMVFDTGASLVVLRAEDARRAGLRPETLTYSAKMRTANGVAEAAPVVIESLTVGAITVRHVPGMVARQGALDTNLLGQSFMARLAGYDVQGNRLILRGR